MLWLLAAECLPEHLSVASADSPGTKEGAGLRLLSTESERCRFRFEHFDIVARDP